MIETCNTQNWAMSHYADDDTQSLCAIGGVLFKATKNGLFIQTAANDEEITAFVDYGRLDAGRNLTRPDSCLMEYAKSGSLNMTVTETQSGKAERYTYSLPDEVSGDLTNGRVKFGRGLRGRHFSYRIAFTGQYAHIEDAYIDFVSTGRRI